MRAGRSKPRCQRMSCFLAGYLNVLTREVTPPPLRPGQIEPFLPPTRAIFQPLWGKTRAERGECLSKTKFTIDAAGSFSGITGMEDYFGRSEDFMVEELEIYVAGTIAVLAKNACDGGGFWRFVLIKQSDGNVVGGMRLCKRTRTETTGSCRKPSST